MRNVARGNKLHIRFHRASYIRSTLGGKKRMITGTYEPSFLARFASFALVHRENMLDTAISEENCS